MSWNRRRCGLDGCTYRLRVSARLRRKRRMRWRRRSGAGRGSLCELQQLCLHLRDLIVRPVIPFGGRKKNNQVSVSTRERLENGEEEGTNECVLLRAYLERAVGALFSRLSVVGRPASPWCCSAPCCGVRRDPEPVCASRGA